MTTHTISSVDKEVMILKYGWRILWRPQLIVGGMMTTNLLIFMIHYWSSKSTWQRSLKPPNKASWESIVSIYRSQYGDPRIAYQCYHKLKLNNEVCTRVDIVEQSPNNSPSRIERDTNGISAGAPAKAPESRDCHTGLSETGKSVCHIGCTAREANNYN